MSNGDNNKARFTIGNHDISGLTKSMFDKAKYIGEHYEEIGESALTRLKSASEDLKTRDIVQDVEDMMVSSGIAETTLKIENAARALRGVRTFAEGSQVIQEEAKRKYTNDQVRSYIKMPKKTDSIIYSGDVTKFSEDVESFFVYLDSLCSSDELAFVYLLGTGNVVKYGQTINGFKQNVGTIELTSPDSFEAIYDLLKLRYYDTFDFGYKHVFMSGYSLLPTISNNVILEIESTFSLDKNWIYKVIEEHRREEYEQQQDNELKL